MKQLFGREAQGLVSKLNIEGQHRWGAVCQGVLPVWVAVAKAPLRHAGPSAGATRLAEPSSRACRACLSLATELLAVDLKRTEHYNFEKFPLARLAFRRGAVAAAKSLEQAEAEAAGGHAHEGCKACDAEKEGGAGEGHHHHHHHGEGHS